MMNKIFPPKLKPKPIQNPKNTNTTTPNHLNNLLTLTKKTKIQKHTTQIHAQIIKNRLETHTVLFTNLLKCYSKCGKIDTTLLLFTTTHNVVKNTVTWTSLITDLARFNEPFRALEFFNLMRRNAVYANEFTFSALLPSCAETLNVFHGEQVHCLVAKSGFDLDLVVCTALIDVYAKCGRAVLARNVFDEMSVRNVVSWNSMIVGFFQSGLQNLAVQFFKEMIGEDGICPDQVSCSSVLSACANMGAMNFGRQVHCVAVKYNLVDFDYVRNSLIDAYFKFGLFDDGTVLFESSRDRDIIAWNVIIAGCGHNGKYQEAFDYFWAMKMEGILPDEVSFSSVLHASASSSKIDQGNLLHGQVLKSGFMKNASISSSLITMYGKCGSLTDAFCAFKENMNQNVVCWTAMIAAYQQHGLANEVIELFEKMLLKGIKPDYITFVCVISACSHAGRVQEGYTYFHSISEVHGMSPTHEHYACVVDLFSRAGQLREAKNFIESMPIEPDSTIWGALLGACASHGNVELGTEVAKRLFELEPDNPGNYVLLSNLYAHCGKLKEADEVRELMVSKGVKKEPGCSWVDVRNETFMFTADDRSHPRMNEIHDILRKVEELVRKKGYVAETQYAVNTMENYKEQSLWNHSEKLALAFALLVLPEKAPIRIKKNLRTCGDCHTVMKFVSEIFKREIIVRDINRFHRFSNGSCSCRDFW